MTRQKHINSIEAQVEVMAAAVKPLNPPAHVPLDDDDMPFWESVIAEFARVEWTDHQLELAAMLARTMADLTEEMVALRNEGSVLESLKGTPVVNPRKAVIQMMAGTVLSFRRSLAMHAIGKTPDSRNLKDRRDKTKAIEDSLNGDNPLEDDLIGRPEGNA